MRSDETRRPCDKHGAIAPELSCTRLHSSQGRDDIRSSQPATRKNVPTGSAPPRLRTVEVGTPRTEKDHWDRAWEAERPRLLSANDPHLGKNGWFLRAL